MFSDHAGSTSGVGTQSRYLATKLIETGKFTFRQFGAAIKHSDYNNMQLHEDFIIKPIDGFGTPEMIRVALAMEKPDAVMIFNDPRFFIHFWEMEDEIHQVCPLVFWHLWDDCEFPPIFNKLLYDSTDLINCINRPTHDFLKPLYPEKVNWTPHGVPKDLFKPLPDDVVRSDRKSLLQGRPDDCFTVLWVARNAPRKRPGDTIWAWKLFLDELEKKHGHRNALLVMHCDPFDVEGPNLFQVLDLFDVRKEVVFSNDKVNFPDMARLYNSCDTLLNRSCFVGDTLVATDVGYKPIRDVNVGENVLTHTGKYKPVLQKSCRQADGIYTLGISNTDRLHVTGEHPLWAIKKNSVDFLINENLEKLGSMCTWTNVSNLEVGDYVAYVNPDLIEREDQIVDMFQFVSEHKTSDYFEDTAAFVADNNFVYYNHFQNRASKAVKIENGKSIASKRFVRLDEDFAYILGLWIADGCTGSGNICLNGKDNKEIELADELRKKIKKVFDNETFCENVRNRLGVRFKNDFVVSKMFSELCGKYSRGKFVPEIILNSNDLIRRAFLRGVFDGDGCQLTHAEYGHKTNRIRTISHPLALGLQTLLVKLGYVPTMHYAVNTGSFAGERAAKIWTIEWRDRQRENNGSCRSWNIGNKLVISRIFEKSFNETSKEDVFNFEVEDDHSYAVQGVTAHNCAEGFGLPVLESMMCGKPPIALKTGGLTRQVVDWRDGSENGIALPVELSAMNGSQACPYILDNFVSNETVVKALLKMYEMGPEKRKELGKKAMEYANFEFDLDSIAKTWSYSLEDCIKNWRGRYKRWEKVTV